MTTLIRNANLATMAPGCGYGVLRGHSVLLRDGVIASITPDLSLPRDIVVEEEHDAHGAWLTPGLIDCHTHLVYAGDRSSEFEMRMEGATYQEISRAGGGIMSTVRATRDATEHELAKLAQGRLDALKREGVTRVEVKSGYGLSTEHELKMLRAAGQLEGATVHRTLLAVHAVPPEFRDDPDRYVSLVCEETVPAARGVAEAVDAFCEGIAFTPEQTSRVFQAAQAHGFRVKLHADQLSDTGGGALAARYRALSADHVEYASPASVQAMSEAGTVAVLLPGAYYSLRERQAPPVAAFRERGVLMALATDHNPGTSPCLSLLLMMNMACVLFGLTPLESLQAVTYNAARALGVADESGSLEVGKKADLALFAVDNPGELSAKFGVNPCVGRWVSTASG